MGEDTLFAFDLEGTLAPIVADPSRQVSGITTACLVIHKNPMGICRGDDYPVRMNRLLGIASLALTSACSVVGIRTEEQPRWESVVKDQSREIRRYSSFLAASTTVEGPFETAQNDAFRILAGYIFGKNKAREQISMTAPVRTDQRQNESIAMTAPVIQQQTGASWNMLFSMPSKYTASTLPEPLDSRIRITTIPEETLATIRFSGWSDREAFEVQSKELEAWVRSATEYEPAGPARYAGYDPPWTLPFFRRNEVMIPVRTKTDSKPRP